MQIDLTGRRALVTGGGAGIGAAIARALAEAGADVAVHYANSGEAPRKPWTADPWVATRAIAADLTDSAAAERSCDAARSSSAGWTSSSTTPGTSSVAPRSPR